jgi:hypothetical protein
LACWPLVTKIAGSNLAKAVGFFGRKNTAGSNLTEAVTFFEQKNPQRTLLRRGSKAVCPKSQLCGM